VRVTLATMVDSGQMSPRHEDFYCVDASLGFFAVAEGRGTTGGFVSRTLIRALRQFVVEHHQQGLPTHRLQVGLTVAYRAIMDAEAGATEDAAAVCALLMGADRVTIARFGGCCASRLCHNCFVPLRDELGPNAPRTLCLPDRDERSLALAIHDLAAQEDDHWLLGTCELSDALTVDDSRLVLQASESTRLTGCKAVVELTVGGSRAPRNVMVVGAASI
jgi:hypothetical protein